MLQHRKLGHLSFDSLNKFEHELMNKWINISYFLMFMNLKNKYVLLIK
jgi:hypothetical protein